MNSGSAASPTPHNVAGYVAQFGYRYDAARNVSFTRNKVWILIEGIM